ncbi:winged helix-turn-helix domain-containing protein [Photobacterium atrarenae]|uniref:Transcriptional regulator n=1 Tax=Photobacterium atrarenae TaxID=865757 RepID=A0ABY5GI60_9GAMM|nr:transcriptional regulator [Photobacterium atrarenae]UTV28480.1 transcriptional regulator [Photobacterium atrarenae]
MNNTSNKYLIGQRFLFDPCDNSLTDQWEDQELIRLGSNESRALSLLIAEPGAIIARARLHDYVWREQGFEVDDSSLTQAISTLRKALKDSTKSPGFIKTVPKRGYQMIASVRDFDETGISAEPDPTAETSDNQVTPLNCDAAIVVEAEITETMPPEYRTLESQVSESKAPEKTATNSVAPESLTPALCTTAPASAAGPSGNQTKAADTAGTPPSMSQPRPKRALLSLMLLSLACIMPLLVAIAMPPKSKAFTPWFTVEHVQILIPKQHPNLASWKPMITACVKTYLDYHPGTAQPVEVIATGGLGNQLWLNYIHHPAMAEENVTLRLHTRQEDNTQLCQ